MATRFSAPTVFGGLGVVASCKSSIEHEMELENESNFNLHQMLSHLLEPEPKNHLAADTPCLLVTQPSNISIDLPPTSHISLGSSGNTSSSSLVVSDGSSFTDELDSILDEAMSNDCSPLANETTNPITPDLALDQDPDENIGQYTDLPNIPGQQENVLLKNTMPTLELQNKSRWTVKEDCLLAECVRQYGPKWREIGAKYFANRPHEALRKRWKRLQGSSPNKSPSRTQSVSPNRFSASKINNDDGLASVNSPKFDSVDVGCDVVTGDHEWTMGEELLFSRLAARRVAHVGN